MKRFLTTLLAISLLCAMMAGCSGDVQETTVPETTVPETTVAETTVPETTIPETTVPETTEPVVYDSFYYFYDCDAEGFIYTDVATFQAVAGAVCMASADDYGFLSEEDYAYFRLGYDDYYDLFIYHYEEAQLERYIAYLEELGFAYYGTKEFSQGVSHYYRNEENGYTIDFFFKTDDAGVWEYVVLEAYLNYDPLAVESFYYFYDYTAEEYIYSDVATYHSITGASCTASALNFGFLSVEGYEDIVDGYDDSYAVFIYEYDEAQLEAYFSYLEDRGYEHVNTKEYSEGRSYFYQDKETGYTFDIFLCSGENGSYEYVAIEPYLNAEVQ